jgi:hypothetical protein
MNEMTMYEKPAIKNLVGDFSDIAERSKRIDLLRRHTAYHEAGHAVFAWRQGIMIREGGVIVGNWGDGVCHAGIQVCLGEERYWAASPNRWRYFVWKAEGEAAFLLAGPLATHRYKKRCQFSTDMEWFEEELDEAFFGIQCDGLEGYLEAQNEINDAVQIIISLGEVRLGETGKSDFQSLNSEDYFEIRTRIGRIERRVKRALRHPRTWAAITSVAEVLINTGFVDWEDVDDIIEAENPPRSPYPRWTG